MPAIRFRASVGTILAAALLITASCSGLDQARAAGVTGHDLVAETANQLAGTSALTYTATYRLAGGATASVARMAEPARTAYSYPTGRLIITAQAVTRCVRADGETVCTAIDPSAAGPSAAGPTTSRAAEATDPRGAEATDFRGAEGLPAIAGMVEPDAVVAMLESAVINPAAQIEQQDTTLAGRHATCLRVRAIDEFDLCVTVEGVLARFIGNVDGTAVEMVLIDYAEEADASDFVVPPGARYVDRRKPS